MVALLPTISVPRLIYLLQLTVSSFRRVTEDVLRRAGIDICHEPQ
jgi:hypothetical protein